MKVTKSSERELNYLRVLLHGDSGVGKTTSLLTLPEDKTIVCVSERSAIPLRNANYPVVKIETWDDCKTLFSALRNGNGDTPADLKEAIAGRKIVAIDSLSVIAQMCIRHIVEVDRRKLCAARTKGKSDTPQGVYEDQMTQEDWGLYRTRLTSLVAAFCNIPYHVIFTCLSAWTEDKITGAQLRTPALSGKFATEVAAHFDLVLHMESVDGGDGNVRQWRTFNDGRVIAKDASGSLDQLEECNWVSVFGKILGKGK